MWHLAFWVIEGFVTLGALCASDNIPSYYITPNCALSVGLLSVKSNKIDRLKPLLLIVSHLTVHYV